MRFQTFTDDYVRRLIQGDHETEHHFVTYFSELLRIKLSRALRNYQAVEDASQETFLRVLRVLRRDHGLASPEKLGAFVNGVCSNVLAEHYRSVARHPAPSNQDFDVPGSGPDPETGVVNEERKRRVRRILDTLPPRDQQILRLLFLEDRPKQEVCKICQVDRNYLRVLLHRAKHRFREGVWSQTASGAL